MTDKTPTRNITKETSNFSPVILPLSPAASSPHKNLTGLPRIARDVAADLYNNIQGWNSLHIKGAIIVKEVALLKSENSKKYSSQLEEYMNSLYEVVESLIYYKNIFESLKIQCKALEKLEKNSKPLFVSLDASSITSLVEAVADAYLEEFKVKETVLENIAHSKNKDEAMFFAGCWTLQAYITGNVNLKLESLLVETGHRTFN